MSAGIWGLSCRCDLGFCNLPSAGAKTERMVNASLRCSAEEMAIFADSSFGVPVMGGAGMPGAALIVFPLEVIHLSVR